MANDIVLIKHNGEISLYWCLEVSNIMIIAAFMMCIFILEHLHFLAQLWSRTE